jgi:hypothetical protein
MNENAQTQFVSHLPQTGVRGLSLEPKIRGGNDPDLWDEDGMWLNRVSNRIGLSVLNPVSEMPRPRPA